MTSSAERQPNKRGRPPEADAHHVARVALGLFEQRGFDAVTMDEIAEASSVSRRTLFRLFPSKSDLVWADLKPVRDVLAQRAAAFHAPEARPASLVNGLFASALCMLDEPALAEVARRRLRLMATSPALMSHEILVEIERALAASLASTPLPGGAPPALAARTLVTASFTAMLWWAEHGDGMTASDAIRAALKSVAPAVES